MQYDDTAKKYIARETTSGVPIQSFQTLASYDAYAKSIGCTTKYPPGTTLVETGFLEFAARDPKTQMRHDAMSPSWEGPKAAEAAITQGLYDLDFAKDARERAKKMSNK